MALLALLAVGAMLCVVRPAWAQRLSFQLFNEESGLQNTAIGSLAQDRDGFLYVGTEAGLYRYDGSVFSRLGADEGLPDGNAVESVIATADNHVWAVFADRIYRIGAGATISAALVLGADDAIEHRAAPIGRDLLLVRDGKLLRVHAESDPGQSGRLLVRPVPLDPQESQRLAADGFGSVHVEHDRIWLGCGMAVCRLDGGHLAGYGPAQGLPADRWGALLRDHDGTLWLRSPGRIAWLPQGADRFAVIDVPGGAGGFTEQNGRLDLVENAAGQVITQSADGLLVREKDGRWVDFDRDHGAPYSDIHAMLLDREGSLWLGGESRGLARIIGLGQFESWNQSDGLSNSIIWGAARDAAGTLWVASDSVVDPLRERGRPRGRSPPGRPAEDPISCRCYALAASPGGMLFAGQQGGTLIRRDPRTGKAEAVAMVPPIRLIDAEPHGPLWVGTRNGLVRIDQPDAPRPVAVFDMPSSRSRVFAIDFDRHGELWVLTDTTLFHRDPTRAWHAVLQIDSQGGHNTRSMAFAPDGTLWLGSYINGVTRLHLDGDRVMSRDRLPSRLVASTNVELIRRDPAGRIWIGTDHGLDVTDGSHWRHLDEQDGLAANDIDENAVFFDWDGTPWFGTADGLSHLVDPTTLFAPSTPIVLHPVITRVRLGNRDLTSSEIRSGRIRAPWSQDTLVIGFAALDFKAAKSIRLRYRLRGVDQGWVETTMREARYPAPRSGTLVFEVMAVDPPHGLGSEPVRIAIILHAPWWRRWPGYVAAATLGLVALALVWRLRVRFLMARQHQLETLVAARTREIEEARAILVRQATFDELTGLLSRSAILARLEDGMSRSSRDGVVLAVALLDLDHFKLINDSYGHLCGDAVLKETGRRLQASLRRYDMAGRYGGEELLLVLPGLGPGLEDQAPVRLEALRQQVFAESVRFDGHDIRVGCSMGVTWLLPGDDATVMIRRADAALYRAKREGRDRIAVEP